MQRVLVAGDNREFNELLTEYLSRKPGIEVTGAAFNDRETMALVRETGLLFLCPLLLARERKPGSWREEGRG